MEVYYGLQTSGTRNYTVQPYVSPDSSNNRARERRQCNAAMTGETGQIAWPWLVLLVLSPCDRNNWGRDRRRENLNATIDD
jgi:hypothetical protein